MYMLCYGICWHAIRGVMFGARVNVSTLGYKFGHCWCTVGSLLL